MIPARSRRVPRSALLGQRRCRLHPRAHARSCDCRAPGLAWLALSASPRDSPQLKRGRLKHTVRRRSTSRRGAPRSPRQLGAWVSLVRLHTQLWIASEPGVYVGCSDEVAVGASGKHGSVVARGACHRSVGQAPAGRGTRWCHRRGPAARASRAGGPPLVCHRVVEPNRVTAVHWDGAAAPACTAVGTLPGCDTHSGGTVSSRSSVGVVAAASVAAAAALAVASAQWFCKRARRSERRKARDG